MQESTEHVPVIHHAGTQSHPTVTLPADHWLTVAADAMQSAKYSAAVFIFDPHPDFADLDQVMQPLLSDWGLTRHGDIYGCYGTRQGALWMDCAVPTGALLIQQRIVEQFRRDGQPIAVGLGALSRRVSAFGRSRGEPEYPNLCLSDLLAVAEADLILRQVLPEIGPS